MKFTVARLTPASLAYITIPFYHIPLCRVAYVVPAHTHTHTYHTRIPLSRHNNTQCNHCVWRHLPTSFRISATFVSAQCTIALTTLSTPKPHPRCNAKIAHISSNHHIYYIYTAYTAHNTSPPHNPKLARRLGARTSSLNDIWRQTHQQLSLLAPKDTRSFTTPRPCRPRTGQQSRPLPICVVFIRDLQLLDGIL